MRAGSPYRWWSHPGSGRRSGVSRMLAIALRQPAQFAPGSRYAYTNYIMLGMLIEKLTGRGYSDELTERIIGPLGLHDTYLPPPGEREIRGEHLHGYQATAADAPRIEPSIPWAAGALVSTGHDLNTFWRTLFDGRLVPAPQLAAYRADRTGQRGAAGGRNLVRCRTSATADVRLAALPPGPGIQ
ncbi:serine hydrolase domain-containing protein [Nocardia sp. NPDC046763]|uniref:serine hydrolase domain-containing protein n=1 Tax=Nocardia sp. NPDC046763 TaxID=3155256 RepID=UPI0033F91D5A